MRQIEHESKDPIILRASNPIQKALIWYKYDLYQDDTIEIEFIWGLQPKLLIDPERSQWLARDDGYLMLDPAFNPALKANQQRLADICGELEQVEEFFNVQCMIRNFQQWLQSEKPSLQFPVEEEDFHPLWAEYALGDLGRFNQ